MDDLIRRADAIEAVAQQWLFEASAESPYVNDDDIKEYRKLAEELFEELPSAEAVEVVRCKDCKWHINEHLCKQLSQYGSIETPQSFYCGFGERREP